MWIYRKWTSSDETCAYWQVGYFSPDGTWRTIMTCTAEQEAIDHVHYLNGGNERLPLRKTRILVPDGKKNTP